MASKARRQATAPGRHPLVQEWPTHNLASRLWASWPESPEMPQSQGPPQSTEERMNPETAPRGLLSRLGELNLGDMGSSDRQQRWSQRKARGQVADCWHSSFYCTSFKIWYYLQTEGKVTFNPWAPFLPKLKQSFTSFIKSVLN